jgi:signal transduction histidine kinase
MKNRIGRMEDLINALLTYSRAGRVRGEPADVDTHALVSEVADVLRSARPDVSIQVEGELPRLFADPVGVQQVFQNLIGNAVKYARATVRVGAHDEGDAYRFYVADDGPGIDPRFHDRIWGMFQRLHAPGEGEGTGIGLAIVRKIAEANHAQTWLESEEGAGATFWVRWPKPRGEDAYHG